MQGSSLRNYSMARSIDRLGLSHFLITSPIPVDDRQLRDALKRKLSAAHAEDLQARIIDELGLQHGISRIDVAVVNGRLDGYEIKSDRDTLNRLPAQMAVYNSVLDRITLVAGSRHIEKSLRLTPEWWGIKLAELGPRGGIRFQTVRSAKNNPCVDAISVARLLWRDEAIRLLEHLGEVRGVAKKPRAQLYALLADVAPIDLLRSHVRECLKRRTAYRFGEQHRSGDG
jgi:hypothetical protein